MKKKILVLQKQSPYGSSLARDGLDYVLTSAAYDQEISLVFMAEGVWQLHANQSPQNIGQKSQAAALDVLGLYDIENVFVCAEDLSERQLTADDLSVDVEVVNRQFIKGLIQEQDAVIGF